MAMHYTEFCHLTVAMIVQKLNEKRSESHWHSRRMRLDILELAEAVSVSPHHVPTLDQVKSLPLNPNFLDRLLACFGPTRGIQIGVRHRIGSAADRPGATGLGDATA